MVTEGILENSAAAVAEYGESATAEAVEKQSTDGADAEGGESTAAARLGKHDTKVDGEPPEESESTENKIMDVGESRRVTNDTVCPEELTLTTDDTNNTEKLSGVTEPETEMGHTDENETEDSASSAEKKPSARVQIRNVPPYLKYKQVKELISK